MVRKKKDMIDMPGTMGSAKIVFTEPTVVKGSHLTVTTYPDGKTELLWDDEALMQDVRNALLSVKTKPTRKTKVK